MVDSSLPLKKGSVTPIVLGKGKCVLLASSPNVVSVSSFDDEAFNDLMSRDVAPPLVQSLGMVAAGEIGGGK